MDICICIYGNIEIALGFLEDISIVVFCTLQGSDSIYYSGGDLEFSIRISSALYKIMCWFSFQVDITYQCLEVYVVVFVRGRVIDLIPLFPFI